VKAILYHLPLIGAGTILGFFALVDAGRLDAFRDEATYGWMVVVWYPLAGLLGLVQVVLWIRWVVGWERARRARSRK